MPRSNQHFGPEGPRIVVVGAGLSGSAFAIAFLRSGAPFASLTLIEKSQRWGAGLAYSTESDALLLNSRTATMGVHGDREDFVYWLADRDAEDGPFARRRDYGAYLEERLTSAIEGAADPVRCIVGDGAVALEQMRGGARVHLASGAIIGADIVVLATGNQQPALPPMFAGAGAALMRDPWDYGALERVAPNEDVLLLGTGMTTVDAVLALSRRPRTGRLYALSRRGLLPRTHTPNVRNQSPRTLPPVLSEALHELRGAARKAEAEGRCWRDVVDELRAATPEMWRRLPLEAKQRFLRHARPYWDVHRHKLAPSIASRIDALRQSGALLVLAGAVSAITPSANAIEVLYRPRGAQVENTLRVQRIVNCTGPNADVHSSGDPLLTQMLGDGYARVHATGLGFDVDEDGALVNARGAASRHLFALGPLTQGAFWEISAVPEIRARANALAQTLGRRSRTHADGKAQRVEPIALP